MTDPICVLNDTGKAAVNTRVLRLASRRAMLEELAHSKHRQVWVLRDAETVGDLIRAMSVSAPGVRRARLISYPRPEPGPAEIIKSSFDRTLLGAHAMIAFEELEDVMRTECPEDFCVGAEWDEATSTVALWRGDLSVLVVPMSAFPARAGVAADPSRLSIEDCGQTIRMGEYEASVDAILFDRDPDYRRRARKRMLKSERGLGASIRRLRLLRRARRADFPGLDEKSLARIERGEVKRPQRATLETIAKKLAVTVEELGTF